MTRDAEAFLLDFHARRPDVTVRMIGRGRFPDGRSGYEVLRDAAGDSRRVLDLACGDGPLLALLDGVPGRLLVGVDFSPEALELARRRQVRGPVLLTRARAQQLPFGSGEFDVCLSHMALMLMGEVEQVAAEIARVLVPGGLLACVLGGGAVGGEAFELFGDLLRPVADAVPPERRMPPIGDRRLRERDGFDEVFRGAGFEAADWRTLPLDLGGTAEQVWEAVSGVYNTGPLEPAAVAGLRAAFLAGAARLADADGRVPCGVNLQVVTARKGAGPTGQARGRQG
jgi:SAM-dependent methyltransferase